MSGLRRLGRRRALAILAAGAGLPVLPGGAGAAPTWRWDGDALGAAARILVVHRDGARAQSLAAMCVAELRRLEAAFSLYRPDSELSRLNRDGRIDSPSRDLLALMRQAQDWGERTGGAFDCTVQPLWRVYADHFARHPGDEDGPPPAVLAEAVARVDYRAVELSPRRIAFARPGMAVTLNGIAQGYITDRVIGRLRDEGIENTLVEMGEAAALGRRGDGAPWSAGIPDAAGRIFTILPLGDRAVATSAGGATRFESSGRFHHLVDPASGACARHMRAVSVAALSATAADALSTALYVTPVARLPGLLRAAAPAGFLEAVVQPYHGSAVRLTHTPPSAPSPANPFNPERPS